MANEIVLTLTALAKEGRTVVSTIHSPTALSFALFDDLMMLKRGMIVYAGPVAAAQTYFVDSKARLSPMYCTRSKTV